MRLESIPRHRATVAMFVGLLAASLPTIARGAIRWSNSILRQQPGWYGSAEAGKVADSVIQYQSPQGGWPKSTDLATPPRTPDDIPQPGRGRANSIDNDATTLPMEFLAKVIQATDETKYKEAFSRGLEYLLEAQYANGGWPQFYPLREGYYSHITFNDGAMINVLNLLRGVAGGQPPYEFVNEQLRAKAAAAVERGIDCILESQIRQNGRRTAWCAQHDEKTLKPAWARAYEPPSLSGSESVGVVRFLMSLEDPSPAIVEAVEGAVGWFRDVAVHGYRYERFVNDEGMSDSRIVPDPDAGPLWARFYELVTNRPLFLGRDSVYHYAMSEIERERRAGYRYYGDWAEDLLEEDYPAWRQKHSLP